MWKHVRVTISLVLLGAAFIGCEDATGPAESMSPYSPPAGMARIYFNGAPVGLQARNRLVFHSLLDQFPDDPGMGGGNTEWLVPSMPWDVIIRNQGIPAEAINQHYLAGGEAAARARCSPENQVEVPDPVDGTLAWQCFDRVIDTPPGTYSFELGPPQDCRTPASRFVKVRSLSGVDLGPWGPDVPFILTAGDIVIVDFVRERGLECIPTPLIMPPGPNHEPSALVVTAQNVDIGSRPAETLVVVGVRILRESPFAQEFDALDGFLDDYARGTGFEIAAELMDVPGGGGGGGAEIEVVGLTSREWLRYFGWTLEPPDRTGGVGDRSVRFSLQPEAGWTPRWCYSGMAPWDGTGDAPPPERSPGCVEGWDAVLAEWGACLENGWEVSCEPYDVQVSAQVDP